MASGHCSRICVCGSDEQWKNADPYYRDQEAIAYDLMETDYVYRKTFIPDAALLGALELRLVMEGIDTLASDAQP